MATLREWFSRLFPSRRDADVEEELRLHLELAAEEEKRRAVSPQDAPRAAVLQVGGLAQSMEAVRDQRGLPWLDALGRDLRQALRTLRRHRSFTTVVLLTLALGIGANTAMFSVLNAVLLRPLPYPNADRLVAVWHAAPGAEGLSSVSGDLRLSSSMYFTYAEQNRTFEHIGVWYASTATITGLAQPDEVRTIVVSDGTLDALGVPPLIGRSLATIDQQLNATKTVLLGYGYWQRRFGADPHVIGRNLMVDSIPREIVGVMPAGFEVVTTDADIILPRQFDRSRAILPGFGYEGVARLKPGVTIAEASADVARLVPIWMNSWPAAPGVDPHVYENWRIAPALRPLKQDVVGNAGNSLWLLMGTIGIVLLIACANVATLLLVRAEARQQELAIRAALGAGKGQIVRALLTESVLLALMGGILGLGVAYVALQILVAHGPSTLPRLNEIALDTRATAFNVVVSLLSGVLFGLIPALRHGSLRLSGNLGGSGRTFSDSRERQRARSALVVAQVALALVLLVCSGLMVRTFGALHAVHPGFTDPASLQTLRVAIPESLVPAPDRVARTQHDMVDKLAGLPGVTSAAFAATVPMDGVPPDWDVISAEGVIYKTAEIPPLRLFQYVSPGYFSTAGTALIAGREYTWTDLSNALPFTMVSENLARELWSTPQAALGKRIRTLDTAPWREVIGVVQDVHHNGAQETTPAIIYWPATGEDLYGPTPTAVTRTFTFVVRSQRAGHEDFVDEVQRAIWSVNPNVSIASIRTMQDIYDRSMARTSFTLVMLALAGSMALILGIVGIYGLISYGVSQRRREIGIRLAIGAQRHELTFMFLRSGLVLACLGVPIGLTAAAGMTRLMSSLLYGVTPLDAPTYLAVPIIVVAAAAIASYLPARRAATVNPVEALRLE